MPALNIKQGDKDNLKGEVAVYAEYFPPEDRKDHRWFSPGRFYAMLFSIDLGTVIHHRKFSDEAIDDILIRCHRPQNCVNRENYDGNKYSSYVLVANAFNSEEEVFKTFQNLHIVFSGNVSVPKRLIDSLMLDAKKYFKQYYNQLEKEQAMIKDKELGFYITQKYINPLVKANTPETSEHFERLRTEFYDFAEREKLSRDDVNQLCAVIECGNPNLELIDAYVVKIEAIATENYEQAAKMNVRIDNIFGLNRTDRKRV